MNFIDQKHKEFYDNTLKQIEEYRRTDVYYRSFVYTLGINQVTRKHVNEIFDVLRGEINVEALNKSWQTAISKKVTELAFHFWNDFQYASQEDMENHKIASDYQVSHMFGCSYAPYFYEAVKLRFPEYTKSAENEEDM